MEQAIWKQRFAALNKMVSKCSFLFKSSTYINEIAKECPNKGPKNSRVHRKDAFGMLLTNYHKSVPNLWVFRICGMTVSFAV